jgi:predicted component of type VI protein secretion system
VSPDCSGSIAAEGITLSEGINQLFIISAKITSASELTYVITYLLSGIELKEVIREDPYDSRYSCSILYASFKQKYSLVLVEYSLGS